MSQWKVRKARVFTGDSIIWKVDTNRGEDITVCPPGAKIEDVAEKAGQVMGYGTGGATRCMWERTIPRMRESRLSQTNKVIHIHVSMLPRNIIRDSYQAIYDL